MAIVTQLPNRFLALVSADAPDWDAVFAEQLPRVYNFLRYRVGNDTIAEDLTSRTFEKAWSARDSYRRDLAGFATWLMRIASNVAIDHLRAQRLHSPLDEVDELAADGTPEDHNALASDIARLVALMERLPQREQEVLALKYGAEATNRNIARLTGLSESNVGTIIHRAVQTLRELW